MKQTIELTAISGEFAARIEQAAKGVLYDGDLVADRQRPAQPLFQVRRGAQVVGVHMGFEQPLHLEVVLAHKVDQALSPGMRGTARRRIVIQHRVDQRALTLFRVADNITVSKGRGIEERFNAGIHGLLLCLARYGWGYACKDLSARYGYMLRLNSY